MKQTHLPLGKKAAGKAAALTLTGPAEQLRLALVEHEKLLASVAKQRAKLSEVESAINSALSRFAARMAPLAEEAMRIDAVVHAMLDFLGTEKGRPTREKKQIVRLHRDLESMGVISPRDERSDEDVLCEEHEQPADAGRAMPSVPTGEKGPERGAIRDLFRRLVGELHPDHVQDENDRATRTEVMKQITVAYREGDFARLVEIERTWATTAPVARADAAEEIQLRLRVVTQSNAELRKQLRAIERELRVLRRGEDWQLVLELKRRGNDDGEGGLGQIVSDGEQEVTDIRAVHDLVAAFRDGKATLAELLAGPLQATDEEIAVEIFEARMTEMIQRLDDLVGASPRRARRPAKRASGKRGRRKS